VKISKPIPPREHTSISKLTLLNRVGARERQRYPTSNGFKTTLVYSRNPSVERSRNNGPLSFGGMVHQFSFLASLPEQSNITRLITMN
jgi:hypothetical protein